MVSVVMDTASGYPISDDHFGSQDVIPQIGGSSIGHGLDRVTDSADVFTNVIPYPAIPVAMAPWGYGMQLGYRWRRTAEIL